MKVNTEFNTTTEFNTNIEINTATNSAWIQGIVYLIEGEMGGNKNFEARLDEMNDAERLEWIRGQKGFEDFPDHLLLRDWEFSGDNVANGFAFYCDKTKETIIGTAGTNKEDTGKMRNSPQFLMDNNTNVSTGIRGGMRDDYFNNLRTLNERLLADGRNVTAITGHSLGGAVAELFGMMYGIQSISYNPSPLRFLPARAIVTRGWGVPFIYSDVKRFREIGAISRNSDMIPLRFVTHKDFLQPAVFGWNGHSPSTYMVPGGSGHDNDNFRLLESMQFIDGTWQRYNLFTSEAAKIKISMSSGEFVIPEGMRVPTNLMGNRGSGRIEIRPEDLDLASNNMRHTIGLRMETINSGLSLAIGQNDNVGSARSNRISTMARSTFDRIGNQGMTLLFADFRTSYELLKDRLPLLDRIADTSMPSSFQQLFADHHGISKDGRKWFLDGSPLSRSTITRAFDKLKRRISSLKHLINYDSFEYLYTSTRYSEHPMTATTSIAAAYISRMNASVEHMEDALKGLTKLRSGSNDAIVDTMDDLFKTLETNITAAVSKNEELARNASLIASNHRNFDNEMAHGIRSSNGLTLTQHNHIVGGVSSRISSGELRLMTSDSLSSSENIIDAQRHQKDNKAKTINLMIQNNLKEVNDRLAEHTRSIVNDCIDITSAIDRWNEILDRQVSSRERLSLSSTVNEVRARETELHLPLRNYFEPSLRSDITVLRSTTTNWEQLFGRVNTNAKKFRDDLPNIKEGVFTDTLEIIYPGDEMHSKFQAVKGIGLLLETSAREYRTMSNEIRNTMSGALITAFATDLDGTSEFFEAIAFRIREDFQVSW